MQTMTVTQRKNIQQFSVGDSVPFILLMLFLTFRKRAKGVQVCGPFPCFLHSAVTEGSGKPSPLTGARRYSSLTFISNFSALGKFLTESHVPYYTVHSFHTPWPGMKQGLAQRVLHQWDPQVSSLFFTALRNWWTEWVSVDQENLWIRGFLWPW